jgi:hypothetical protein
MAFAAAKWSEIVMSVIYHGEGAIVPKSGQSPAHTA